MNQKSNKNQPKIDQEDTENPPKNQSKIDQKSTLEGSRGVLGGTWRPIPKNEGGALFFETLLGPSWRPLGPSWRPLGAVLAVLAASWARLGLVLAAEIGPQVDQRSTLKSIRTLMPLGNDFLRILVDFTSQNGAKMPPKTSWKSMSISKGYFFKKPRISLRKTMILVVLEAQLRTA